MIMIMVMIIMVSFDDDVDDNDDDHSIDRLYVMYAVLGPTDPEKAPTGSLRNMMFLNWQSLGERAI